MSKTKTSDQLIHILTDMGDKDLDSHSVRSKNYTKIINSFNNPNLQMNKAIAEQMLDICMMDLTCDLQYSSSAIVITSHILKKIKGESVEWLRHTGKRSVTVNLHDGLTNDLAKEENKCDCSSDKLLQSALTITKTAKILLIKPLLRKLTFETLLSFPDEILINLVSSYSGDVIDLIDSLSPIEPEVVGWISQMIVKLLKILPPEKKKAFVRKGLHIVFDFAIPSCLKCIVIEEDPAIEHCIAALELLTDCVKHLDYSNNPKWEVILKNICDANKYPAVLKTNIQGNYWHRLWKIFITLLKDQITKMNDSGVSPINALLPVVEQAFKMDIKSRCLAFECWNVLIDNFSTELNENLVNKRLKLLMIPLKLNNAKVEETVLAKLNSWWHLVRRFQSKMDKFTDMVLIPFLHFCFGKADRQADVKTVGGKVCVVPGQLTPALSVKCIEVLVEIVGHINCPGCCTLPSVETRLMSAKLLAEHWGLWVYCLQNVLKTAAANYSDKVKKQITCLWKGLVVIIGELPENQIRADLFSELLDSVDSLLELCKEHNNMTDIIFDVLIKSLFVDDPKIRSLLKSKNGIGPMHAIFGIIVRPSMECYFARSGETLEDKIDKLKPITTFMIRDSMIESESFQQYVKAGKRHDLWAALCDAVCDTRYDANSHAEFITELVFWPVRTMSSRHQEYAEEIWYRWYNLYSYATQLLNTNVLHREVLSIVSGKNALQATNIHFKLWASVALLKQILLTDKKFEAEAQILLDALTEAYGEISMDKYLPILIDTLHLLLRNISSTYLPPSGCNVEVTKIAIMILQVTFKLVNVHLNEKHHAKIPFFIENLMESSRKFLSKIISLNVAFPSLDSEISKLRTELEHAIAKKSEPSKGNNISEAIENKSDEITKSSDQVIESNKKHFTTPEPKSAKKTKLNKKVPNIVNTVVENGEKFVVVKSNWKFNPRNLTENQKEKFKRKREDIPALYQDLSQSQDEFKLKTWKTDSQDATTSKSESNSKSNDDVAVVFQNLPNTEVVPKIIENILNDSINKITSKNNEKTVENLDNDNNNKLQKIPTPKGPKTPRMALKDRVFRNVRNLIKKSGLQSEITPINQSTENLNQTVNENVLKTPISNSKTVHSIINSDPPKISSERPTRCIKKPKKFEDTEMFALKKKRRSQSVPPQDDMGSDKVELSKEPLTITKEVERNAEQNKSNKDVTNHQKEPQIDKHEKLTEVNAAQIERSGITENIFEKTIQPDEARRETEKMEVDEPPVQASVIQEQQITANTEDDSQVIEEISTPKPDKAKPKDEGHSTIKKKRSRIEKQLLIDTVEGHPVLQQPESKAEKRVTRKHINMISETNDTVSKRRKSFIEKSNKIKAELVSAGIVEVAPKDKPGSKSWSPKSTNTKSRPQTPATAADQEGEKLSQSVTVLDSQEKSSGFQDFPMSEDIIESSQDSTLTAISVKSTNKKKVPIVCLDKENLLYKPTDTQTLIDDLNNDVIPLSDTLNDTCNQEEKEDIELPKNKTMPEETVEGDLTENMDTEPMESSGEVIIINDEETTPIIINTEDTVVGKETQELAEADTLPVDVESQYIASLSVLVESESITPKDTIDDSRENNLEGKPSQSDNDVTRVSSQEDRITPTLSVIAEAITDIIVESSNTGSPLKDEVQRKKEFLNNTIEISPIKTLSPVREKKSPSPETSSDYVVIKLTSPVQSNGEPFNEKCDSPEVFTEDKISPEKRDQSPPRKEVVTTNSSPSSSLSLKKNRPQMRFNGRAAQMLGLCVPENMQILNTDKSDVEENRKNSPVSTPARRNLKRFYAGENNDKPSNENESEESENFLKFTRPLPTAESSPCNPILKRKLADIADDTTISPASKRKRVSFHDPPVSTTVSVQKYIEPCGVRSPSNSANKRQERQIRSLTNAKSPKRLESVFRLETVLTKAVESFTDENTISNDTEMSLDETPAAEVVITSELNDTDPICPELLDCNDPIQNIAGDLASPYTKALLIKELASKVETVADLAKMTELEVNRLRIKAPKVLIAKKVLSKYASKNAKSCQYPAIPIPYTPKEKTPAPVLQVKETKHTEIQTNEILTKICSTQTAEVAKVSIHTQTEEIPTAHCSTQTNESGSKSTKDIVSTFLNERPDFVDQVSAQLPLDTSLSLLLNKMTASNSSEVLNQVLSQITNYKKESEGRDLKILQEHLLKSFDTKDLMLFASQLIRKICDKLS